MLAPFPSATHLSQQAIDHGTVHTPRYQENDCTATRYFLVFIAPHFLAPSVEKQLSTHDAVGGRETDLHANRDCVVHVLRPFGSPGLARPIARQQNYVMLRVPPRSKSFTDSSLYRETGQGNTCCRVASLVTESFRRTRTVFLASLVSLDVSNSISLFVHIESRSQTGVPKPLVSETVLAST